jgi:enterochelin esterase-like enzyme
VLDPGLTICERTIDMHVTPGVRLLAIVLLTGSSWSQAAGPPVSKPVSPEVHPDGRITFRLQAPKAEQVSVVCEAVGTQPMQKDEQGVWSLTVGPVAPGIYDASFDVDGLRITDPLSPNVFGNRQGSRGYVEVPGPAGHPRHDEWRDVPHGTVSIHWYTSAATGGRRRVHVYSPPGYHQEAATRYPVLYLLHGAGDNDSHWTLLGRANVIADNLLADGRAVPMLIVMPDGHAASLDRERERERGRELFEKDLLESVVAANQKIKLLWIGVGKDDFLLARNREFVKVLDELKVRHTYQETDGRHAWGVWRGYLAEFLPLLFR